jgi:Kef-type K+ transport system membrane component KefB
LLDLGKVLLNEYVGHIYLEITVIICVAAVLTILFRFFKQPSIFAYILTGILLGPVGIFHLENSEALVALGQLGITLLLFMLGLELKLRELRSIGKTAIIAGSLQMWFTFFFGFFLSRLVGLPVESAIYGGIAVSFSSTIIIVKLLSDKRELNSLHGKITIGMLLVQDFFAVLTIVFLTGSTDVSFDVSLLGHVGLILLKVAVLFLLVLILSTKIFPRITKSIAKSSESLFLFSLAWVLLLTAVVSSPLVGFSVEIGGFLAGLALANTAENFQIVARMKALRDFFITIFFVMLGLEMQFSDLQAALLPALVLAGFLLAGKPVIIMMISRLLGYRKRTGFLIGTSMAQISEFSLIILFMGNRSGAVGDNTITMFILAGMVSFIGSSYVMQNSKKLYKQLEKYLHIFEPVHPHAERPTEANEFGELNNHIVIIGAHQMGQSVYAALEKKDEHIIIVDFDPDTVVSMRKKGANIFFGDIADTEIQERAGVDRAKLVISTVPDLEDNLLLIEGINHKNKRAKVVVMAYEVGDAKVLYKAGADYVVLPHLAGGRHLAKILLDKKHLELIEDYKEKDISFLE